MLIVICVLILPFYAKADRFALSDTLVHENDSLITSGLFFKTDKKTKKEILLRKSLPFLDSLVSFLTFNKEVEIELIRFHSPMVRPDYKFLGNSCKVYAQLDLAANYMADWGVHILRIRLRACQEFPIARDFEEEKLTIVRITKAPEDDSNPFKK